MIMVIGSVIVKPGSIDRAQELSTAHSKRSRIEPGCASHAVHRDCENAQRLVFVEEWADQASLRQHFSVPESGIFVRELTALAVEPPKMAIYEANKVSL